MGRRTSGGLGFGLGACVMVASMAAGCSDDGKAVEPQMDGGMAPAPLEDCTGKDCAVNSPEVNWKSDNPTFQAHLRFVDGDGKPLKDVEVVAGDRKGTTDADGKVVITDLSARRPVAVSAELTGMTPLAATTDLYSAHKQWHELVMFPIGVEFEIDPSARSTLRHGGASLSLPEYGLSAVDGTGRPDRAAARLTHMEGERLRASGMAENLRARTSDGRPAQMRELISATYFEFEAPHGAEMNLSAGRVATLDLRLPQGRRFENGDRIAMWSLDEASHTWVREGDCEVRRRGSGDDIEQFCTGSVTHFSFWGLADEIDIYRPDSVGCLNFSIRAPEDACYTVTAHRMSRLNCEEGDDACSVAPTGYYSRDYSGGQVNQCAITPADSAGRMILTYSVDTRGCKEGEDEYIPAEGRRVWVTEPIDFGESFKDKVGSELMLNFTFEAEPDCEALCVQAEVEITQATLEEALFVDFDEDGYFVEVAPPEPMEDGGVEMGMEMDMEQAADAGAEMVELTYAWAGNWKKWGRDCDDGNPAVHPHAWETVCSGGDFNCDGTPSAGLRLPKNPKYTDVDPGTWNSDCWCLEGLVAALPDEIGGNYYDDDCDGFVEDSDGDGFLGFNPNKSWSSQPSEERDCDDWDEGVNPGEKEVDGNRQDENCDGQAIDYDGDGYGATSHLDTEDPGELTAADFTDCNDRDANFNPGQDPEAEIGQAAGYYYAMGGDVRRRASYCGFFAEDGSLEVDAYGRVLLLQAVRDLNCDELVTDADGDGFTRPGDESLGVGLDVDCDDLDPRIIAGDLVNGELDCSGVDRSVLVNDSQCNTDAASVGLGGSDGGGANATCPPLAFGPDVVQTVCAESLDVDGNGTGSGVCSFLGWEEGNPLTYDTGTLWGPCDGQVGDVDKALDDCPAGSVCGGDASGAGWSDKFKQYVEDRFNNGDALSFYGMCFPTCTP